MAGTAPKVGMEKTSPEPVDPMEALHTGNVQHAGAEIVAVEKISDLLFRNQMQDYDRRFSKLK